MNPEGILSKRDIFHFGVMIFVRFLGATVVFGGSVVGGEQDTV